MECECPVAGWCQRYKKQIGGRAYEICKGTVLTPEKCEAYRQLWLRNAATITQDVANQEKPAQPGIVRKTLSYGRAMARWVTNGSPVRSQEEQAHIYENICKPCEHFVPNKRGNGGNCGICGCALNINGQKIAWKTESCPANPPKWTSESSALQSTEQVAQQIVQEDKPMGRAERIKAKQERVKARAERIERRNKERLAMGGVMPEEYKSQPVVDGLNLCDRYSQPIGHALRGLWNEQSAFFVCGGPSLKQIDLSFLRERGIVSLGLNNVAGYAPVRAMTFSDPAQKFHHGIFFDPAILKFVPRPKLSERVRAKMPDGTFQWTAYPVRECPSVFGYERDGIWNPEEFLTREKATWGVSKKHKENEGKPTILFSFFLGIRLLHYLGVKRIYLLGVDFKMDAANHYAFGQYRHDGAINGNNNSYRVATGMLQELRPYLEQAGLNIYQTNPNSALRVFDHVPLETAIEDCRGLVPKEPFNLTNFYEKPVDGANPATTPDTDDRGE